MVAEPSLFARIFEWLSAVLLNWRGLLAVVSLLIGFIPRILNERERESLDNKLKQLKHWPRRVLIGVCVCSLAVSTFLTYDDVSTRLRRISSQPDFEKVTTWSV